MTYPHARDPGTVTSTLAPKRGGQAGLGLWLVMLIGIAVSNTVFAWEVRERSGADAPGEWPVAIERGAAGDLAEVFRDSNDLVYLKLTLVNGFTSFALSHCATFQIDQRVPLHHYGVGERCKVADKEMTIILGNIVDGLITSLPLHRLMNGNQVAFRFVTSTGEYRQSMFSLRRSKQMLTQALGSGVRVEPKSPGEAADPDNS